MSFETDIKTDDQTYVFDKNTGEKFAIQSSLRVNNISHHHLKSVKSGKTVLLSDYGIQRRFSGGPDQGKEGIKSLIPRFLGLR